MCFAIKKLIIITFIVYKKTNEILKSFKKNNHPSILVGDLNAEPGSSTINLLETFWTSSYSSKNLQFTYPSNAPSKKIDYVMFHPRERWKVLNTEAICDTIASDHCAYLVTMQLLD